VSLKATSILHIASRATSISQRSSQAAQSTINRFQHSSTKRFPSDGIRRKRGQRLKLRNMKSASKNYKEIESTIKANEEETSNIPIAFFFLGVFPIVGMGALLVVRDDLREQFKERWGLQ
jgi:hypothetical protein